jgi:hypothetical protein
MTAVEKIIAEIEQELQDREGCNGALNSGALLGLTNAKNIAYKYLEIEKEQIKDAYYKGGDDLTKMHFIESEQYYNETFKSE